MTNRTCSLPDCDRRHTARGFCKKHYYGLAYEFPATPCRVPGCDDLTNAHTGDGLCSNHYGRVRRHGDTSAQIYGRRRIIPVTLADVLFERSRAHGDCVLWTGGTKQGYAVAVLMDDGTSTSAHRASWIMANGPIPEAMTLDHVCHNRDLDCAGGDDCEHRRCLNPEHLEVVTQSENSRRRNEHELLRKARSTAVRALAEAVAGLGEGE